MEKIVEAAFNDLMVLYFRNGYTYEEAEKKAIRELSRNCEIPEAVIKGIINGVMDEVSGKSPKHEEEANR